MSISTIFVDRVSAYPNQYRLVPQGGSPSLVTLERADEPTTPGTPLNAETLNGLVSQINTMETEVKAYTDNKVAETVSVAQYASAKGTAASLDLNQGEVTPIPLGEWRNRSNEDFTFSEDGGMVMPTNGTVLVFGVVYFNTSTPEKPEQLGVYVKKNETEVGGQLTYSVSSTAVHMAPIVLDVEEGDVLTLCARNTTNDGSCIPNGTHTALTVYYLTGGGSVVSGGSGDHTGCIKTINGLSPDENGNIELELSSEEEDAPTVSGAVYVMAFPQQTLPEFQKAIARNNIGAVATVNGVAPDENGNVVLSTMDAPTVDSGGDTDCVKTVNGIAPDENGNVEIAVPTVEVIPTSEIEAMFAW